MGKRSTTTTCRGEQVPGLFVLPEAEQLDAEQLHGYLQRLAERPTLAGLAENARQAAQEALDAELESEAAKTLAESLRAAAEGLTEALLAEHIDVERIGKWAYLIGERRALLVIHQAGWERRAASGLRQAAAGPKGSEQRRRETEERMELAQAVIDDLHVTNPRLSVTTLRKRAAAAAGLSYDTVMRALLKPSD